jgi:hypothetical protein
MESDDDITVAATINPNQEEIDPYICLTIEEGRVIMLGSNLNSELEVASVLRSVVRQMERTIDRRIIL